jgi:hypothetical protein
MKMTDIKTGNSTDVKQAGQDVQRRWMNTAIVLLVILILSQIINTDIFNAKAFEFENLPVSIKSGSEADYSQDPYNHHIPPISEKILNQIITDFPATGSPQDRMATLQVVLSTPVPTMKPGRLWPANFTPTQQLSHPTIVAGKSTSTLAKTPFITATRNLPSSPTVVFIYSTSTLSVSPPAAIQLPPTVTPTDQPTLSNTPVTIKPTKIPKPTKPIEPTKIPKPTKPIDPTKTPKPVKTK